MSSNGEVSGGAGFGAVVGSGEPRYGEDTGGGAGGRGGKVLRGVGGGGCGGTFGILSIGILEWLIP